MKRRFSLPIIAGGFLATALAVGMPSCAGVPLFAPPGSELSLTANPRHIPAHGGVSVVTAFVTDGSGLPVADGTVVLFYTDLGRVEPQGKTRTGFARVNFTSDSRSGVANVTAVSGGEPSAPTPSPTPSPTTQGGGVGLFSSSNARAFDASETITITIGNARIERIFLRAEPNRIRNGNNSTTLVASVFGEDGNPVANVPVFFAVHADDALTERVDDPGPVFTDNNGEARTTLRTNRTTAGVANVVARTPDGTTSDDLAIPID